MKRPTILLLKAGGLAVFALIAVGAFLQYGLTPSFDSYYYRFTQTTPPSSLLLGSSRVAQGLQPASFERVWQQAGKDLSLLNYAFTLGHSPFGEGYLNSIKRKLGDNPEKGVFILGVDPWMVSLEQGERMDSLRETALCVNQMEYVNFNPNFEYAFKFLSSPWYQNWVDTELRKGILHRDGWLEISVDMAPDKQHARHQAKLAGYQEKALSWTLSDMRMTYLKETIAYLLDRGKVMLVRLPVSQEMEAIERQVAPNFEQSMQSLASTFDIPYLSYWAQSERFEYTDGNHLWKESGQKLSEEIAQYVVNHLLNSDP